MDMKINDAGDVWTSAYEQFLDARARNAEASSRWDKAYDAVVADAPMPEILQDYAVPFQRSDAIERAISNDEKLSFDRKAEMVAALREWKVAEAAADVRHGYSHLANLMESDDGEGDALCKLIETQPPSYSALLDKLRALVGRLVLDSAGESADDEEAVSRVLTVHGPFDLERSLLATYLDVLRLEGCDSPALRAKAFDAEAWVAEFETLPGHEVTPYGVRYHDAAFEGGPVGQPRWEALTMWQKEAVLNYCKDRQRGQRTRAAFQLTR